MLFQYETDRLILKTENESAADQVLDFYHENKGIFEAYEPITAENFYTKEYQKTMLSYEFKAFTKSSLVRFFIYSKDNSEKIIGTVSFRNIVKSNYFSSCEIGYKISKAYWNQGIASEAIEKGLEIIFSELHMHRVEALVLPDNFASIAVLEKFGFKKEGTLRKKVLLQNSWKDHDIYSLLEEEWDALHTARLL